MIYRIKGGAALSRIQGGAANATYRTQGGAALSRIQGGA